MRPLRPATAQTAAIPRLHAGWRLLFGAAPLVLQVAAHADATLPGSGRGESVVTRSPGEAQQGSVRAGPPEPVRPCPGLPPKAKPPGPPKPEGGTPKAPDEKAPPAKRGAAIGSTVGERWMLDEQELAVTVLTHPHGPDEPCRKVVT